MRNTRHALALHLRMMIFKSIETFGGRDPCPGVDIAEITPLSLRALTLMHRNRTKPLLQTAFLNILGAIEMLAGMEYHHDRIDQISMELAAQKHANEFHVFHEGVAYVNRLGQFSFFARSNFVTRIVPRALESIPTIEKFLIFRNKHTAHRSMDAPKGEDDGALMLQAMSLTRSVGKMMSLKPGAQASPPPKGLVTDQQLRDYLASEWNNRYITFQIFDSNTDKHVNLTIQKDHLDIAREAFDLLSALILWEPLKASTQD